MRNRLICFFYFLLLVSCSNKVDEPVIEKKAVIDTIEKEITEEETEQPAKLPVDLPILDTKSLHDKAAKLVKELNDSSDYTIRTGKDTLIDLNGDRYSDVLIEFYKSAGTGLKNAAHIYLYNNRTKRFLKEPIELPNPAFNFENNTVVSYYIGLGGGYATELKWHGLKLDTLEAIDVDNEWGKKEFKSSTAIIHNYLTGADTKKVSDMVWLPEKYKYGKYQPLIRRE